MWDGSAPSWLSVALQTSSRDSRCLFQTVSVLSEGPGRAGRSLDGSVTPWAGDGPRRPVGVPPTLHYKSVQVVSKQAGLIEFYLNKRGFCSATAASRHVDVSCEEKYSLSKRAEGSLLHLNLKREGRPFPMTPLGCRKAPLCPQRRVKTAAPDALLGSVQTQTEFTRSPGPACTCVRANRHKRSGGGRL